MIQRKKIAFLGFPFFFMLPWLGFIFSLFDIKAKSSGVVYIATAAIFCFAFSFTDQSADSYRYALSFQEFDTNLTYEKLVILYQNGELRDLYRFLLYYLASLFSQNPKVMFAFAGMFYGYFSYQNMKILNMEFKGKLDKFTVIISLCFFVYCSFSNVNGLRFTTGAMVMFFSTYNLIIRNKLIYIIGVFALPLFHYGFVLLVPIIIGYLMINKFMYSNKGINKLLLTAFIIAFVLSWVLGINSISLGFLGNSGVQNYEIIPYYGSVYKSWKMINQCDFMIATRLHAAIIAAFADVPFILNEYHQKCTDFLDDWSQNTKFRVGDA